MNRALAIVAVLSLFVAGIAIGALGMHIYQDRLLLHPDGDPEREGGFVARRLHRLLDLSDDQQQRIETILRRSHEEAMALRDDVHPRVMAIMDRAHEEIAGLLTDEQRETFQRLLRDNRRRAESFFLGPPGRGRGRHWPWGGPARRPWRPPPDGSPGAPPPDGTPEGPPADDPPPGPPADQPPPGPPNETDPD